MRKCFFVLVIMLFSICHAHAFDVKGLQPLSPLGVFSTFSAESLGMDHYGFGVSLEKASNPNLLRTTLQTAFGLRDNIELELSQPYVGNSQDDVNGLENLGLGIKHRIYDGSYYTPSIAYMLTASLDSGQSALSTGGSLGGGILISKKVGPFKGHMNVFYSNPGNEGLKDQYSLYGGLELAVAHTSTLLAEINGEKDYFKNKLDLLQWRLGYRLATTDNIFTSIGAEFNIKDKSSGYRLIFAVSVLFPWEKTELKRSYEE